MDRKSNFEWKEQVKRERERERKRERERESVCDRVLLGKRQ